MTRFNMVMKLKVWAAVASSLMAGDEEVFPDIEQSKDLLYEELFKDTLDTDLDIYTQISLELIVTSFILIIERQAKDQLDRGKYFQPSEELQRSSRNVPTTNTVSERDFAILDILLRLKPAAAFLSLETYILWINNKPSAWLKEMDPHEKDTLLTTACKRYPQIRQQFHARKLQLRQQHISALHAKLQIKKRKTVQRKGNVSIR